MRDVVDEIVAAWRTELPAVAGLPLEVAKRTTRLAAMFDDVTDPVLAEHGLTRAEYGVLATLRARGAPYRLRPSEVSGSLVLTSGGASNVLKRLTATGLVARDPNPDDGRSSWVTLTPAGVERAEAIVLDVADAHQSLLAPLAEDDGRALADALRDVLTALDRAHPRRAVRR